MNTWKTADAVVQHPEATIPVSERGHSLVDGRGFFVDAPLEGDVRITPGVRTYEGGQRHLEDLGAELTEAGFDVRPVRRFWTAVAVAVGILAGWGHGEDPGRWDAFAGVRDEPTVLGLTVTQITNFGLDAEGVAR